MQNFTIFIGRFNPMHIGHLNTVRYLSSQSKKDKAIAYIGLTNTNDDIDNPLTFKEKIKYAKLAVKQFANVKIVDTPVYAIYDFIRDICFECQSKGGGTVKWYAGSDRISSYKKIADGLIKKYNSRNELTDVKLTVVEAAVRGSTETYSATQMRQHVKDNDLDSFIKHCPFGSSSANKKYGTEVFNLISDIYSGKKTNTLQHNITSVKDVKVVVANIAKSVSKHYNEVLKKNDALYSIGGSVRDEILGKEVHDFDLVTTMEYREYAKLTNADKVNFRNGLTIVIPVINGEPFETACLGRGKTIEDRCNQSDLTINAIAKDLATNKIIDPLHGREDLKKHIIELTPFMKERMPQGKQPAAVMRAIRFASIYGWKISNDSMNVLKSFAKATKGKLDIKDDYFKRNWEKIQKANATDMAISLMKTLDVYEYMKDKFGKMMTESQKFMSFMQYLMLKG